jgi:hypothetical protein
MPQVTEEQKARKREYMKARNAANMPATCSRGHEFTPENTIMFEGPQKTFRRCKICQEAEKQKATIVGPSGKRTCRACRAAYLARPDVKARTQSRQQVRRRGKRRSPEAKCERGHQLTPDNVFLVKRGEKTLRFCKTCDSAWKARQAEARRAKEEREAVARRKQEQERVDRALAKQKEDAWFDWVVPWRVANQVALTREPTRAEMYVIMAENRRLNHRDLARRIADSPERVAVWETKVRLWREQHPDSAHIAEDPRALIYPGLR